MLLVTKIMPKMSSKNLENYLKILIGITILFAPLYVIRWQLFDVLPTTLLELLILAMCAVWVTLRISLRDFSIPAPQFSIPVFLIVLASIIGVIVAENRVAALGIARAYIWEPVIVFYIIVDVIKKGLAAAHISTLFLTVYFMSCVWIALMGILQYVSGLFIITPDQFNRAHAVFNNGNALALFIGPAIAAIIGIAFRDYGKKIPGVRQLAITFCVLLFGFIFTWSTGGFIALILMIPIIVISQFAFIKYNKDITSSLFRILVAGSLGFSAMLLIVSPLLAHEAVNPWVREGGTAQIRLCLWEGTAHLLKENLVLGVGLSGFKEAYASTYYTCDAEPLEYPHNFWMTVMAELGALGVLGFVWLLWVASKYISRERISFGLSLALSYILLHGLIDVPYFKNDLSVLFWMLLALLLASGSTATTVTSPKRISS